MSSEHVVTERRGAVLRIAMNRPDKKNALTLDMYERLCTAIAAAAADESVRVLVIAGAPGVFTAGNDLGDFMKSPPTGPESPVSRFIEAIHGFPKPIVAAVDGPAVGLGTTMLLHCDLVLATDRARFTMPFTRLGLVPEAASSVLVPAIAGRQRAAAWLMLGRPFDAKEALETGIIYRVVAPSELDTEAMALAEELAGLPREAVLLTKGLLRQGSEAAVRAALDREGAIFVERLRSPETMQALMAFMTRH